MQTKKLITMVVTTAMVVIIGFLMLGFMEPTIVRIGDTLEEIFTDMSDKAEELADSAVQGVDLSNNGIDVIFEWDGDTTGMETENQLFGTILYKTDYSITKEDMLGATMTVTWTNGEEDELEVTEDMFSEMSLAVEHDFFAYGIFMLYEDIAGEDNPGDPSSYIEIEKGVYVMSELFAEGYFSEQYANGYTKGDTAAYVKIWKESENTGEEGPEMNEYGFYYNTPYVLELENYYDIYKMTDTLVLYEDGSVRRFSDVLFLEGEYDKSEEVANFSNNGTIYNDGSNWTYTLDESSLSEDAELNEYGFYYGAKYTHYDEDADLYVSHIFEEDGIYYINQHTDVLFTYEYSSNVITYTDNDNYFSELNVSQDGKTLTLDGDDTITYHLQTNTKLEEDTPELNTYGFYYDTPYVYSYENDELSKGEMVVTFYEDNTGALKARDIVEGATYDPSQFASFARDDGKKLEVDVEEGMVFILDESSLSPDAELNEYGYYYEADYYIEASDETSTMVVKYVLHENGTYDIVVENTAEGTYTYADGEIVVYDADSEEVWTLVISSEGKVLTEKIDGEMVFYLQGSSSADEEETLEPGLYDANGELVKSWSELTTTYGLDVETDYLLTEVESATGIARNVLVHEDLTTGVKLVVGDVDKIGDCAFASCVMLEEVVLPKGLTSIGNVAFSTCTNLKTINLPNGLTTIASNAFNSCTSLENVSVPGSVTSIGSSVFDGCTGLEKATIGSGVAEVASGMFRGCINLQSVSIPNTVTSIENSAFESCEKLANISLPSGLKYIGTYAFMYCDGLTTVNIPDDVETIEDYAFCDCENLQSISLPSGLTTISKYMLKGCPSLSAITIPSAVTTIERDAFKECTGLTSVTIPSSVATIEPNAFEGCTGLTDVTFINTNGWYLADYGGNKVSDMNVTNTEDNATNLKETQVIYHWCRTVS